MRRFLVVLLWVCLAGTVSAEASCFDAQECYNFNDLNCIAPGAGTDDDQLCLGRRLVFSTETRPISPGFGKSSSPQGFEYILLDPETEFPKYKANTEAAKAKEASEDPASVAVSESHHEDEDGAECSVMLRDDGEDEPLGLEHIEFSGSDGGRHGDEDGAECSVMMRDDGEDPDFSGIDEGPEQDDSGGHDDEASMVYASDGPEFHLPLDFDEDGNKAVVDDDDAFEVREGAKQLGADNAPAPGSRVVSESHLPKVLLSDEDDKTVSMIKAELAMLMDNLRAIDQCDVSNPDMARLITGLTSLRMLRNLDLSTLLPPPVEVETVLPKLKDESEWRITKFVPCRRSHSAMCQGIGEEDVPKECRSCELEVLLPKTEARRKIRFRVYLAKVESADAEFIGCMEVDAFMDSTLVVDGGTEMPLRDMFGNCFQRKGRSMGLFANLIPELDPRNIRGVVQTPQESKPPKEMPKPAPKEEKKVETPKVDDETTARTFCVQQLGAIAVKKKDALPAAFQRMDLTEPGKEALQRLLVFASSNYQERTSGHESFVEEVTSFHLMGHLVQAKCKLPALSGQEKLCSLMIDETEMRQETLESFRRPPVWATVPFTPQAVIDYFNFIRLHCTDAGTSPLNIHGFRVTDVKMSTTHRPQGPERFEYLQYDFMIEDIPISAVLRLPHDGKQFVAKGDLIDFSVSLPSQLTHDVPRASLFSDPPNYTRRDWSICHLPPQETTIPKLVNSLMLPKLSDRDTFEALKASINRYRVDHCKLIPIPHHFFRLREKELLQDAKQQPAEDDEFTKIPVTISGQDYFAKYDAVHGQLIRLWKINRFKKSFSRRLMSVCDLQPLIAVRDELSPATDAWDEFFSCVGTIEDIVYSKYYPQHFTWNLIQRSPSGYRRIEIDGFSGSAWDITPQPDNLATIDATKDEVGAALAKTLEFLEYRFDDAEGNTELFLTALNRVRSDVCKVSRISRDQLTTIHVKEWTRGSHPQLRGSFVVDMEDLYSFQIGKGGLQYMKPGLFSPSDSDPWCQDVLQVQSIVAAGFQPLRPFVKLPNGEEEPVGLHMSAVGRTQLQSDIGLYQDMLKKVFSCSERAEGASRQKVLLDTACYVGCGNVDMALARTVAVTAVQKDVRFAKFAPTLQLLHASYTFPSQKWRIKFLLPPFRNSILYFEYVEDAPIKAYKWGNKPDTTAVHDVHSSSKKIISSVLDEVRGTDRPVYIKRWIIENCGCQEKVAGPDLGHLKIQDYLPPCKIRAVIETGSSPALYALQVNLNRMVTPNKWFLQHFVSVTEFQMPLNLRWDPAAFDRLKASRFFASPVQLLHQRMDHIVDVGPVRYCLMIHDRNEKLDRTLFDCSNSNLHVEHERPLPAVKVEVATAADWNVEVRLDAWFHLRSFFIEFNAARRRCLLRPIRQVGPITQEGDRLLLALSTGSFLTVTRVDTGVYSLWAGHPCQIDEHDFDTQALVDYNRETLFLINEHLQNMNAHILRSSILQWRLSFTPFKVVNERFEFEVKHTWDILFKSSDNRPHHIPNRITLVRLSRDHTDQIQVLPFVSAASGGKSKCVQTKEHPVTIRTDLCSSGAPSSMAPWVLVCDDAKRPGPLSAPLPADYSRVVHFTQAEFEALKRSNKDDRLAMILKFTAEMQQTAVQWDGDTRSVCRPFENVDTCTTLITPSNAGGVELWLVRAIQKIVAAGFTFGREEDIVDFTVKGAPRRTADNTMAVSLVIPSYHEYFQFVNVKWDLEIEASKCELEASAFVQKTNKLVYAEATPFRHTEASESYYNRDLKPASLDNAKLCALWKSQCEMAMLPRPVTDVPGQPLPVVATPDMATSKTVQTTESESARNAAQP